MVIVFKMSMVLDIRKCNLRSQQCLCFHVWFILTVYYKMRQILQNGIAILLRNATKVYSECVSFFIAKYDSFITKCDDF